MRANRTLCVIDGSLSNQNFGVGAVISKNTKVESYPRCHSEGWFRLRRSIYSSIISFLNDGRSKGHHIKATRVRRTSRRCSICFYRGHDGRSTFFKKDPLDATADLGEFLGPENFQVLQLKEICRLKTADLMK